MSIKISRAYFSKAIRGTIPSLILFLSLKLEHFMALSMSAVGSSTASSSIVARPAGVWPHAVAEGVGTIVCAQPDRLSPAAVRLLLLLLAGAGLPANITFSMWVGTDKILGTSRLPVTNQSSLFRMLTFTDHRQSDRRVLPSSLLMQAASLIYPK